MIRGDRFELDLDSDELAFKESSKPSPFTFVGDVLERNPSTPAAVSAPVVRSKTGFPEHRKRPVQSRFKRQQDREATAQSSAGSEAAGGQFRSTQNVINRQELDSEKAGIDQQNREVLAGMSEAEIDEARRELMSSMDPDVLQSLLRRADIDSGSNAVDSFDPPRHSGDPGQVAAKSEKAKKVTFNDPPSDDLTTEDASPESRPTSLQTNPHNSATQDAIPTDHIHFPTPSQPPSLDPNSSTFLTDLHAKYFPSLPSDPSKLAWMQPSNAAPTYTASASALSPSAIRFNFTGALLAPRTSAQIPVSAGLHHHGAEPEAAGYTIPELAHLARSTYPAQRAIVFQTLGRILYRLGVGEFGNPSEAGAERVGAEDSMGELARGLWREVARERVVDQLVAESEGNGVDGGRHVSARAYATEAVWLWRKGGGRVWKAD